MSGLALGSTLILTGFVCAGDGVLEINQACAVNTGCFPGDAAGFPVTISAEGSYRLTGDLVIPDEKTNGIDIATDDVSLDLNGFRITCANSTCPPGTGHGIAGAFGNPSVVDGTVEGFGDDGIHLTDYAPRIERVRAVENHGDGIQVGRSSTVIDSSAILNGDRGILAGFSSVVRGNTAAENGSDGIFTGVGTVVEGNVSNSNGGDGFNLGGWNTVVANVARSNTGDGIDCALACGVGQNVLTNNGGAEIAGPFNQIGTNQCDADTTCP